ncbi:MAG TPA: efflux RND transporter periplasmic adaptor subunit [Candidatus Bathyarchaeia archaeon]|nr:efflux RND transporter periplasmic adaptor subunit [Candidatus Bathyarchaeia archaeon]
MSTLDTELAKLRIEKGQKRPQPTNGTVWFAIVFLVLAVAGGYFWYEKSHPLILVETVYAEHETSAGGRGTALLTATGYVIPRHKIEISSKIIGRIREIYVKRGDVVKAGDILITLDDEEYQARVKSTEAMVATLKARVAELRAGSRPQEVEASNAAVASAEATLKSAQLDMDRLEALFEKRVISKQELDRARMARDVARARWEAERKTAELVRIGPRPEQIEAAAAQLRQAEAELAFAKTQLDDTVIRAPIAGTILERIAEKGETVTNMNLGGSRGAKSSVVSMADLNDLQVEVDLNENDLAKVKLDQACKIRLDSNPDKVYTGEVDEIAPQADRQKATVQVKVRLIEPDADIKIEVNARVTFFSDTKQPDSNTDAGPVSHIWVPTGVVVQKNGRPTVYLVTEGTAVEKPVKLGVEGEQGIEITDGLEGNEALIIRPPSTLRNGDRVTVSSK